MNKMSLQEQENEIENVNDPAIISKRTSLGTLITWNISKALEKDPDMDIKGAMCAAQSRLDQAANSEEIHSILSEQTHQRYLVCALLAWQELGHHDTDSLCRFFENSLIEQRRANVNTSELKDIPVAGSSKEVVSKFAKAVESSSKNPYTMGPVLKLPVETKVVMRIDTSKINARQPPLRKPKSKEKDVMSKIEQACCLDSMCIDRLAEVDTVTAELRTRAAQLARREAERVELLERAEAAWRDLENGYQRRLRLAEEKEDDIARQIRKVIDERNTAKAECTDLMQQLQESSEKAEKDRARLTEVEKQVCSRACVRLKLSEESAKGDSMVAEQQCRAAQVDRDLQFKEEQARRKISNMESELDSARAMSHEVERALREELSALREQIEKVSQKLIDEATDNEKVKANLEDIRKEKLEMIEDLEGCQQMCDGRMQGKMDELKTKRDQLNELKNKVMECRCKLPVDAEVEVKRTPSLAALCKCTPEDKILGSCSCTSMRDRLLSNLLSDLFSGLQGELGGSTTMMPCQLLKCLEDKHNWDSASVVKANLTNYFSQLIVSELDIAIATSIEKYHVKWVGQSCADKLKMKPEPGEIQDDGWQERAIERSAQKLATQLAEQLFQDRAEELTKRAKEIASSGPPPCECKPKGGGTQAAFPCLVSKNKPTRQPTMPIYWHQAFQDVTQLKMQIEDLKKDSIKKEDLKIMETKFTKIIQRASCGATNSKIDGATATDFANENRPYKDRKNYNSITGTGFQPSDAIKPNIPRKRLFDASGSMKKPLKPQNCSKNSTDKTYRPIRKKTQTYAVNVCLCSQSVPKDKQNFRNERTKCSKNLQNKSKDFMSEMSSSILKSKPIYTGITSQDTGNTTFISDSKTSDQQSCLSNCVCFNKIPSNTSIDKLLETLAKWKSDLDGSCHDKNSLNKTNLSNKTNDGHATDIKQSVDNHTVNTSVISSNTKNDLNKMESDRSNKNDQFVEKNDGGSRNSKQDSNVSKEFRNSDKNDSKLDNPIKATESEYIGAINLDKSIEDFCKCENEVTTKTSQVENRPTVFKCIASNKCNCRKSLKRNFRHSKRNKTKDVLSSLVNIDTEKQTAETNGSDNLTNFCAISPSQNKAHNKIDGPKILINIPDSRECGYQISFLGVTLTDANLPMGCSEITERKEWQDQNKRVVPKSFVVNSLDTVNTNKNVGGDFMKSQNDCALIDCAKNEKLYQHQDKSSSIHVNQNLSNKDHPYDSGTHRSSLDIEIFQNNDLTNNALKEKLTCQCNDKFDEFKNFINATFGKQLAIDIALDVQSFSHNKNQEECCICCEKISADESNDLEENTFALLEEYLKKKLAEFKESSCSSNCIPVEEEQTLFTVILEKVKKLISDSTKQIACKCSPGNEKSQGSWNRAYSLLQEYLRTKIKKVQCSCLLAEDNNDTILPTVLEKICNLIEYDFKRLKNVCECKNNTNNENMMLLSKQNNISYELPEQDSSVPIICTDDKVIDTVSFRTNIFQDTSLQVPSKLGTQVKSCSPMSIHNKNLQTVVNYGNMSHSVNTSEGCFCMPDIQLFNNCHNFSNRNNSLIAISKFPMKEKYNDILSVSDKNKDCSEDRNSKFRKQRSSPYLGEDLCFRNGDSVYCDGEMLRSKDKTVVSSKTNINILLNSDEKRYQKTYKPESRSIENIDKSLDFDKNDQINDDAIKLTLESYANQTDCHMLKCTCSKLTIFNKNYEPSFSQPVDIRRSNSQSTLDMEKQSNKKICLISVTDSTTNIYQNGPYVGYTVDCTCKSTLGTCNCPKSISKAESDNINSIWKKYIPNETYFRKVSYIMNRPMGNTTYCSESVDTEDNFLKGILKNGSSKNFFSYKHDLDVSTLNNEDLVLKKSTENLPTNNMMTNTIDNNAIVDTDHSNNDDALDWCECYSNMRLIENSDSERLKKSLYFPAPIDFDENNCKKYMSANVGQQKNCECEMVPICHVKMLVENIETKLASSKCTCDSLSPHVCPEHSVKY